jgi:hypothetical protein
MQPASGSCATIYSILSSGVAAAGDGIGLAVVGESVASGGGGPSARLGVGSRESVIEVRIEVRIEAAHSFAGLKLGASAFAHVLRIASALSVSQFVPLDIQGYFESIPPGGASPLPLGVCLPDVVIPDVDLPDTGSCSD